MSQAELARETGLDPKTIRRAQKQPIVYDSAKFIADALGVDVNAISSPHPAPVITPTTSPTRTDVDRWFSVVYGRSTTELRSRMTRENVDLPLLIDTCAELWRADREPGVKISDSSDPDAKHLSLTKFDPPLSDDPVARLTLRPTSWDEIMHSRRTFDPFATGVFVLASPASVLTAAVAHVIVVTKDDYVVVGLRSDRPHYYPNCWSASYEEHWRRDRDFADPFETARRGLKEEILGPAQSKRKNFKLVSLFREYDLSPPGRVGTPVDPVLNVGLLFLAKLDIEIGEVFARWRSAAAIDKAEFRHIAGVPYAAEFLWSQAVAQVFSPTTAGIVVPEGIMSGFPDAPPVAFHPSSRLRLYRALTDGFESFVVTKYEEYKKLLNGTTP